MILSDGQARFEQRIPFGTGEDESRAVAVVGHADQANGVFFNEYAGAEYREVRLDDPPGSSYGLAIGDLNEDGYTDIAVANSGVQSRIYLRAPVQR
ncbi:MAG: hypothetical protein ACI8QZ_000551 [Chlamydiales bacterium]